MMRIAGKAKFGAVFIYLTMLALTTWCLSAPDGGKTTSKKNSQKKAAPEVEYTPELNREVFGVVWNVVDQHYYDPTFGGHDWVELRQKYAPAALAATDEVELYKTINAMLGELGVSHLGVNAPRLLREIEQAGNPTPTMTGLRWLVLPESETKVVLDVTSGGPADKAGVKRGWIVLSGPPEEESAKPLKEGDVIRWKFLDEKDKPQTVKMTCRLTPTFQDDNKAEFRPDGILTLQFNRFDEDTEDWVDAQLSAYVHASAVVVDLRSNTGGAMESTRRILARFFETPVNAGTLITRKDGACEIVTEPSPIVCTSELVVLVSRVSGSGAEIFASVVQCNQRGTIVGWTSTGRTAGQVLASGKVNLPDGGELELPIADYICADGSRLEGNGVKADILAPPATIASIRSGKDDPLEFAVQVAAKSKLLAR